MAGARDDTRSMSGSSAPWRTRPRSSRSDLAALWLQPRVARLRRALEGPERIPRVAVVIGRLLGAAILVCLATGAYSHLLQEPLPGMRFPTEPAWLYRVTQGAHVLCGTMAIPLLLAKLWVVYPRLFQWPPARTIPGVLERVSVAVLVASTGLELLMGLLNTFQWYPWPFDFRTVHVGLAWVVGGSVLLHVAVKLPMIAAHWRAERGAERA